MTKEDLDLVPASELIEALMAREGISMVIGTYDHKAQSDGSETTLEWGVLSCGSVPIRVALRDMIVSHIDQVRDIAVAPDAK